MAAIAITYAELKKLNPCSSSRNRVAKLMGGASKWTAPITAQQAKDAGCTFDEVVWVAVALARENPDVERRLRLWVSDCAARVLHIYEKTEASDAPRNAIIASRQFARGEIDAAARDAARDASWDASWVTAWDASWVTTWDASWDAARDAALASAWVTAWDSVWPAAWGDKESWQFGRLIQWLSENEPEDWPLPERAQLQAAE